MVLTEDSTTTPGQLPPTPNAEFIDTSGDESVARQRTLGGDSVNDKQWSYDLSNQSLHQTTCPKIVVVESTNLSLREDGHKDAHCVVPSADQCKNQQRGHSVNCTRLDEHGDDGLVQSTASASPHGSPNAPGMQSEPDDNHEGEEDIE